MEIVTEADVEAVEAVPGVFLTAEAAGERTSVQGFTVEPGAEIPEHRHDHEQAGMVTAGMLTFLIDDEERPVSAGESYVIPGDEPHAAVNHGDVPVEGYDVFSPPRLDPDWMTE
ncbi:Mannose-6-phosphate isomerase, cupin superfamily [Halopenitus malekzadehii]|uniref:Mannose-6-phosphate isomerase, cupin superfamily n=1 Tax=Halopenitus malekzadehii TaxID=1267564 RepID=A0A1H6JVD7_9EURY|nr:cupin domain-containing protein [Halopenitus malekzadehii]SEH66328.1 Mannose-6-phosphate isomerase, cupin superfamily [Halopenitus malekzadehii]